MKILIVEDDPLIAAFPQHGLNTEGNFCVVSNDGESGLSLAQEGDVAGLRMGADDFITKPFSFVELRARIDAVLRRNSDVASQDQVLRVGRLAFDRKSLRFTVEEKEIDMTAKELALIELLMSKPGILFSRQRILYNV